MGCDIHGWIEIKPYPKTSPEHWESVVDIGHIVGRNYDMFGLLFGVRNYPNYQSIAEMRGIPSYDKNQKDKDGESDYRPYALRELEKWNGDAHGHSYISLSEIENIDWEKESEDIDERIHLYIIEDGKEREMMKASSFGELSKEELNELCKKKVLVKGDRVFKFEKTKYKDAISGDWNVLFDIMRRLGKQQENNDNVRMVVWFDN